MSELDLGETRQPLYDCVFSRDGVYRYSLVAKWDKTLPRIAFIGLNPSTADEYKLDPTLTRIRKWAERWGFGSFVMLNLFAFRTPNPTVMVQATDPVGPQNDTVIQLECRGATSRIVVAWGEGGIIMGRGGVVTSRLKSWGKPMFCLGRTSRGFPIHPLARGKHRVPDNVELEPYHA